MMILCRCLFYRSFSQVIITTLRWTEALTRCDFSTAHRVVQVAFRNSVLAKQGSQGRLWNGLLQIENGCSEVEGSGNIESPKPYPREREEAMRWADGDSEGGDVWILTMEPTMTLSTTYGSSLNSGLAWDRRKTTRPLFL